MKWSKYNALVRASDDGWLLYNTLSNAVLRVDDMHYGEIERLRASPDDYDPATNPALYFQLLSARVILDAEEEETLVRLAHIRRLSSNFDGSVLALVLLPTLGCNFVCDYCFESYRRPVHMTQDVEDHVVEFARKFENASRLTVSWFGGEPLTRFKTISRLTDKLRTLGLPLQASLITNGYLLRDVVISRLDEVAINVIQITIDGPQDVHDRRHLISGAGTYAKIMANIDRLLAAWDGTLHIRVNIDATNRDDFPALHRELRERFGRRVIVGTGMVLPAQGMPPERCHLDRDASFNFHLRAFKEHGIDGDMFTLPRPRFGCMATQRSSWVIGPSGELYKCLQDAGDQGAVIGSIMDPARSNPGLLARYMLESDPFENPECHDCIHLPVCDGGCPYVRMRGSARAPNACCIEKDHLDEYLRAYLESKAEAALTI